MIAALSEFIANVFGAFAVAIVATMLAGIVAMLISGSLVRLFRRLAG